MAKQIALHEKASFWVEHNGNIVDAYTKNENGYNLLHQLIIGGRLGRAKTLVTQGIDVNIKTTNEGMNSFQLLCNLFRNPDDNNKSLVLELAKTILEAGNYNFKSKDNQGWNTWQWATDLKDEKIFLLIKEKETVSTINNPDTKGLTPLHWSCDALDVPTVGELVKHGANLNAQDVQGLVPFTRACSKVLSYRTANINLASGSSFEQKAENILDMCLDGNFNPHLRSSSGDPVIHWVFGLRSPSALEKLCNKGANVDAQDKEGKTCVYWAAKYNWISGLECLGGLKANMDIPGHTVHITNNAVVMTESITPLLVALTNNPYEFKTVETIISFGADINKPSPTSGNTPLITSVMFNHPEAVEFLLEKGADGDVGNHRGVTPLIMSVMKGNYEIANVLVKSGKVDINKAAFSTGETPFLLAVLKKDVEIIKLFFGQKAQSIENYKSISPLKILIDCKNKLKEMQLTKIFTSLEEDNQNLAKTIDWSKLNLGNDTELFLDLMGDNYPIDESSVLFEQ